MRAGSFVGSRLGRILRESNGYGVGVQLSSWTNSLYQFVSHVLPLSFENACSHFATTGKCFGFNVCSHFVAT